MDKLPDELLLEVFKYHFENHPASRSVRLLQVCKRWYAIMAEASVLWPWGNILLSHPNTIRAYTSKQGWFSVPEELAFLRKKRFCRSIDSFIQAIEFTRGSKLDLTFLLPRTFVLSPEASTALNSLSFSNRCRALKFVHDTSQNMMQFFNDLPVLEYLEITGWQGPKRDSIIPLLEVAERTSKRLHSLKMRLTLDPQTSRALPKLLPRIVTLHLWPYNPNDLAPLLKISTSVKALILQGYILERNLPTPGSLNCPSPSLDTISFIHAPFWLASPTTLNRITHLILQFDQPSPSTRVPETEMQSLTHLNVEGYWPLILYIKAPLLHSLKLHGKRCYKDDDLSFGQTTLRPIVLDLDVTMVDEELRSLIWGAWNDVEDLQIVYIGEKRSLLRRFASAFMVKAGEERLCPKLRRLVFLSETRAKSGRVQSEKALKAIANERKGEGVLTEVKYGWYEQQQEANDPRDRSVDWVNVIEHP